MRCHICNATLGTTEVQWSNVHNEWEPCGRCLQAIDEVFNDRSEEEIDAELAFEFNEEEPGDEQYEPDTVEPATEAG